MEEMLIKDACIRYLKKIGINTERITGVRDYMSLYNLLTRVCEDILQRRDNGVYVDYNIFLEKANELKRVNNKTFIRNIDELRRRYGERNSDITVQQNNLENEQINLDSRVQNVDVENTPNIVVNEESFKEKYFNLLNRVCDSGNLAILNEKEIYEYINILRSINRGNV